MKPPFYKEIPYRTDMYEPGRSNGMVFEHREVAAQSIGRRLRPEECVHHVDEDRLNNSPDNLMVFSTVADHSRFHKGAKPIPNGDGTFRTEPYDCKCSCGNPVTPGNTRCRPCYHAEASAGIPAIEVLEELIWSMPTTQVATMFGVSDVAVAKWCKKYGISKPPRGYWKKQAAANRT